MAIWLVSTLILASSPACAQSRSTSRAHTAAADPVAEGDRAAQTQSYAQAAEHYRRALAALNANASPRERRDIVLRLARVLMPIGNPAEAAALLEINATLFADDGSQFATDEAHHIRMSAASALGKYDEQVKHAQILVDRYTARGGAHHPTTLDGKLNLGTALILAGRGTTARGDRSYVDGLRGLPTALAIAGAKRSIVTLWPVSGLGAANFMLRYYQHLWHLKRDYAEAFRRTKLEATAGKSLGAEPVEQWQASVMFTN